MKASIELKSSIVQPVTYMADFFKTIAMVVVISVIASAFVLAIFGGL